MSDRCVAAKNPPEIPIVLKKIDTHSFMTQNAEKNLRKGGRQDLTTLEGETS